MRQRECEVAEKKAAEEEREREVAEKKAAEEEREREREVAGKKASEEEREREVAEKKTAEEERQRECEVAEKKASEEERECEVAEKKEVARAKSDEEKRDDEVVELSAGQDKDSAITVVDDEDGELAKVQQQLRRQNKINNKFYSDNTTRMGRIKTNTVFGEQMVAESKNKMIFVTKDNTTAIFDGIEAGTTTRNGDGLEVTQQYARGFLMVRHQSTAGKLSYFDEYNRYRAMSVFDPTTKTDTQEVVLLIVGFTAHANGECMIHFWCNDNNEFLRATSYNFFKRLDAEVPKLIRLADGDADSIDGRLVLEYFRSSEIVLQSEMQFFKITLRSRNENAAAKRALEQELEQRNADEAAAQAEAEKLRKAAEKAEKSRQTKLRNQHIRRDNEAAEKRLEADKAERERQLKEAEWAGVELPTTAPFVPQKRQYVPSQADIEEFYQQKRDFEASQREFEIMKQQMQIPTNQQSPFVGQGGSQQQNPQLQHQQQISPFGAPQQQQMTHFGAPQQQFYPPQQQMTHVGAPQQLMYPFGTPQQQFYPLQQYGPPAVVGVQRQRVVTDNDMRMNNSHNTALEQICTLQKELNHERFMNGGR